MTPKRSEERYDAGGRVLYVTYQSEQRLRNGKSQPRTHVKRVYLPGDSRKVALKGPDQMRKRTGRSVHGVELHYEHLMAAAKATRGNTTYNLPERWAERAKVLELPKSARNVKLTDSPPEGARMSVA